MQNKQYSILIVEDDVASGTLIRNILRKEGYTVDMAADGLEALRRLKENFYPVVITDLMMPNIDGLKLCKAIRDQEMPGYVFIMMLTALGNHHDIISGLEAGADEYLTKPVNPAELLARLNTGKRILGLEKSLKSAYDQIHYISITDPLTGIYHRRYITAHLPEEIARANRYERPLSLIMCDIDHFKEINDTLGHQAGDEALKKFASMLKKKTRIDIDWLARFGGEEFLIVLPETERSGATTLAERIRESISGSPISFSNASIQLTASFGVTGFDNSAGASITADLMISAADKALYQSKEEGRNRVTSMPIS